MMLEPMALEWHDTPMPNGSGPVRLSMLSSKMAHHFWALVEFAPGWQRLCAGHYSVDEDFFLLNGDLSINHERWQPQGFGFIAAQTLREETHSQGGALVLARFYGKPRWQAGPAHAVEQDTPARSDAFYHAPSSKSLESRDCLGHGPGRVVYSHAELTNWLLAPMTWQSLSASSVAMDVLDLSRIRGAAPHLSGADSEELGCWACLPQVRRN